MAIRTCADCGVEFVQDRGRRRLRCERCNVEHRKRRTRAAPAPARSGLVEVMATGDYRRSLEVLRDTLAAALASAGARETAPIGKQLADVLRSIDELDGLNHPPDALDELIGRREARRRAAEGQR